MAKVLLYNIESDYEREKFEALCKKDNVGIIEVGKESIDQKVGYLLGLDGYEKSDEVLEEDPSLDFPFILFEGFERNQLFNFLDHMRNNGLAIQHKANETENNVRWTLRELLIENDKEGKTMGLVNRINGLAKRYEQLKEEYGDDEKIKNLLDEIQNYFNDQSIFELEVAEQYLNKLVWEVTRFEEDHK